MSFFKKFKNTLGDAIKIGSAILPGPIGAVAGMVGGSLTKKRDMTRGAAPSNTLEAGFGREVVAAVGGAVPHRTGNNPPPDDEPKFYEKTWFWGLVSGVIAVGTYLLTSGSGSRRRRR